MKTIVDYVLICIIHLAIISCNGSNKDSLSFEDHQWIHGSADCDTNNDPLIQVFQYNRNTWILRQNKCVDYEAPFMFLFLGDKKAILFDTGATKGDSLFPLFKTVRQLLLDATGDKDLSKELIVAHTHSHSDHFAADSQFIGKPNITVVGLELSDVVNFFNIQNWPSTIGSYDLGNRNLQIIPVPGHERTSIAIYDRQTGLLLTGDIFYPGRLYVRDWAEFKHSIKRLVEFSNIHDVSYLLGCHIEMSRNAGIDYSIGSTYHPEEHQLHLTTKDLNDLNIELEIIGDKPIKKIMDKFIIYPV